MRSRTHSAARQLRLETLEPRQLLDASALRITEFAASNDNLLNDYEGDSSDWVEIFNSGATPVDLGGLHLTDRADELDRWTFPAGASLPAGGYMVVFASGKDTVMPNGELHASFALSAGGEYLALSDASLTVIDHFSPEFPQQYEDVTYGRAMQPTGVQQTLLATGATGRAWRPTHSLFDSSWMQPEFSSATFNIVGPTGFGYENSPGSTTNFVAEIATNVPSGSTSIYLRVPFTLASLAGVDRLTLRMMYDDGFVAYLNGVKVAEANAPDAPQWNSVAEGSQSDSLAEQFRDFDISTAVPHLQAGDNVLAIHALNRPGSSDMLSVPELVASGSTLVQPERIGFFEIATPGYGNEADTFGGYVADPTISLPHGFYDAPQVTTATTTTADALVLYTTDGSTPEVDAAMNPLNGTVATGPIAITGTTTLRARAFREGYKPSFVTTTTYIYVDDVVQQSPDGAAPAGWPSNNVNGQLLDYGVDPQILVLHGEQAVKDALLDIPSISITTDTANLFDPVTGIYVNALNRGRDWERPASVELINPDGTDGFTINAGLRIRGGYSRNDFNPKHAFRFYFRGDYGAARLEFPLFGDEGTDEFDVLDLRTAQNYSWSMDGDLENTFLREVFSRDAQRDLGQPYTRSRYYHLYLDGQYWGLYQTQERVEEFYGESYFGGDEDDYDVLKSGLGDVGGTELSAGNDIAWRQLFDYGEALADNPAANADLYWTMQGLNPDGTRNAALPVLLDVDNLVDYMSILILTGGYDTGISYFLGDNQANNWFGIYNRATADRGFQFFMHDNEHSLGAGFGNHGSVGIDRTGPFNNGNEDNYAQFNPQYLHQDLLESAEYRQRFIDRVQMHFFNDGALTPQANAARMLERYNQISTAIIAESARWGDAKVADPYNQGDWSREALWVIRRYFPARQAFVLSQLRSDGLYTTFDAPSFSQHGGVVSTGYELEVTAPQGVIYYTTDGATDPRDIGGGVNSSPAVQIYAGPLSLLTDTTVRARVRTAAGEWSGLVEADFTVIDHLQGDYDRSNAVTGADFLLWQRASGTTVAESFAGADGNGDLFVDAADLELWADRYGDTAPPAVAVDSLLAAAVSLAPQTVAVELAVEAELTGAADSEPATVTSSSVVAANTPPYAARRDLAFELLAADRRSSDQAARSAANGLADEELAPQVAAHFARRSRL